MKQNKGFAPVLIMVGVVLVLGVVGYFMVNKGKTGGALPPIKIPGTAGLGLNVNCKLNDPELCRFMDKSIKTADSYVKGFVGTSITTEKSGKKSENTWEMQGNNSHFTMSENGKELSNMIIIGNTTYTKDMTDGKWTKFTYKAEDGKKSLFNFDPEEMKKQFKDVVNETEDKTVYKAMGKEACGSMQCFKYEIVNPLNPKTKEYLYFDDQEYVMRKMRIEDEGGMITETMFEFKAVTIKEPSPIKESAASNAAGTFDPAALQKLMEGQESSVDTQKLLEQAQSQNSLTEETSSAEE